MKNKKILALATGAVLAIIASQKLLFANDNKAAAELIDSVLQHQATIQKIVPVNKDLQAYILSAKNNGRKALAFGDTNNQYLILGNVLDKKGTNLTQTYTQKYILPDMLNKAFTELKNTTTFTQGSTKAKHQVTIVADPNCIYCHLLYKELQPQISKGNLQVNWLIVGILKPDSISKAAAILAGTTNAEKIANLQQDEEHFNLKQEEGGISNLSKNKTTAALTKAVENNSKFLIDSGYEGTPVMFFKDKNGKPRAISGYVKGKALTDAIEQMDSKI